MLRELVEKTRSYRRFHENARVEIETLKELINLARLSASGGNVQPLKYILSCDPDKNALIFPHLQWAGYLEDWPHPDEGERPAAYVIVLGDTKISRSFGCDHGIAVQNILLGTTEKGLGGCIFGSIDRANLRKDLKIPEHLEILLVVALGQPIEKVVLETAGPDGDIRYWRDENHVHHVPKRPIDEIILDL